MITARSYCSKTRRVATTMLAVSVIAAAALVFPKYTWAAVGNNQICAPSLTCTIGEFVYDDSYNPLDSASCTITSRYPNGTIHLNAQSLTYASEDDGWYSYSFTAPTTTGLYRTEIRCTVGSDVMAIDKSFEVKSDSSSAPSANDVAAATWSYSDRTLSSFGTLVSDIWNAAARTLTGAGLTSGSIATKADVNEVADDISSVSTRIDTINTNLNSVSADVESIDSNNSSVVEAYLNQPIIQHVLQNGGNSGSNLEVKIDNTKSSALLLATNTKYVESKAILVYQKWNSYSAKELEKILGDLAKVVGGGKDSTSISIISSASGIYKSWNFQEAKKIATTAESINISLNSVLRDLQKNKKSAHSKSKIATVISSLSKMKGYIGAVSSRGQGTLYARIQETEELSDTFESLDQELYAMLKTWGKEESIAVKAAKIEKNIIASNQLPKIGSFIAPAKASEDETVQLKNEILSLIGVVKANKEYLAQDVNAAFASTSLEIGSIIFKSIITNPSSSISQTVPLTYELPAEVKKEHIVAVDDGLEVVFDPAKDAYVISGVFDLKPNESKTLSVEVDDKVFEVSPSQVESMRNQAEKLSEPLKNTSYFAQGVTLTSDINASLDRALALQESTTPEEKIKNYREAKIEINSATDKMTKLKELVAQAGSIGTFFGFVGGAQTLGVWGMIIVMVAGFVFLSVYMRSLRKYDIAQENGQVMLAKVEGGSSKKKKTKKTDSEELHEIPEKHKKRIIPSFKVGVLVMGSIAIVAGVAAGLLTQSSQAESSVKTASSGQALGLKTEKPQDEDPENGKEVTIFVPEDSAVSVFSEASINSTEVVTLNDSTQAIMLKKEGSFTRIRVQNKEGKITGWVDNDFIEEQETGTEEDSQKTVIVDPELENYLKVRSEPVSGEIVARAYAGDLFPYVSESNDWIEIELEDGSTGFISSEFVQIED